MRIVAGMSVIAMSLGLALAAGAQPDCSATCSKQYKAAMAACQAAHPGASQSDALQSCMDQAQQAYGQCMESCPNPS